MIEIHCAVCDPYANRSGLCACPDDAATLACRIPGWYFATKYYVPDFFDELELLKARFKRIARLSRTDELWVSGVALAMSSWLEKFDDEHGPGADAPPSPRIALSRDEVRLLLMSPNWPALKDFQPANEAEEQLHGLRMALYRRMKEFAE